MHTFSITEEWANDPETDAKELNNRQFLVKAIRSLQEARARVYRTYVHEEDRLFVLITSVKELHLSLGAFTDSMQESLCLALESEFGRTGDPATLFFFPSKDVGHGSKTAVLASRMEEKTESEWLITYHLSLAY